jgi:hypothetical protein
MLEYHTIGLSDYEYRTGNYFCYRTIDNWTIDLGNYLTKEANYRTIDYLNQEKTFRCIALLFKVLLG